MKQLLLIFSFLFSSVLFAQNDFKEAYYIDNQGKKIEGFIKNSNFNNINEFTFQNLEFKKNLDQKSEKIDKSTITEFGFVGDVKYVKTKAKIDDVNLSSDFGSIKEFTVKEVVVFLNVLVEGSATLYSYEGSNGTKYLYKVKDKDDVAKQLLYKKYYKRAGVLEENNIFREQLFNNIKCENQIYNDFLNVRYYQNELVPLFVNYNKCTNNPYTVFEDKQKKTAKLNFSVLAGYNVGNFSVEEIQYPTDPENFGMISVGGEVELVLPSGKLGVFGSVEYKNAKASTEQTGQVSLITTTPLRRVYKLETYFVDVLFGGRYYKNFSKSHVVFIGAGAGMNITSGNFPTYQSTFTNPDLILVNEERLGSSAFITFQLGYKFNNHYGFDINYDTPKKVLGNKTGEGIAKVSEFGINLRYTF